MILKSLTRTNANYKNLLEYIFHDSDTLTGKNAFVLQKNISGSTIKEWEKQLKQNEKIRIYHRNKNIKMFHEIISFNKIDTPNITITKLKTIGKRYLQLRGDNMIALGTVHKNKEHLHLHFCISSVEIHTGRSLRLTKENFKNLKNALQNYHLEKFPEINNSTVDHNKKQKNITSEKEYQLKKRGGKSERELIKIQLEKIYKQSDSSENFYKRITESGITIYSRNGKPYGIQGKRKNRFQTMGFTKERLQQLDILGDFNKIREFTQDKSEKNQNLFKIR
jgi:hypothetical protein